MEEQTEPTQKPKALRFDDLVAMIAIPAILAGFYFAYLHWVQGNWSQCAFFLCVALIVALGKGPHIVRLFK